MAASPPIDHCRTEPLPLRTGPAALKRRGAHLAVTVLMLFGLPLVSGFPVFLLQPQIASIDPNGYWLAQTISMGVTLVVTLVMMKWLSPQPWAAWGFNLRHWRMSLWATALFIPAWAPLAWGFSRLQAPPPGSTISPQDQVAVLLYLFTLCSVGQEVLFRGFAIPWLRQRWDGHWGHGWLRISHAGLLSAVIFMLAHVRPSPPHFDMYQLAVSLALGLVYAKLFERTGSLLGPILIHSISNTSVVALLIFS